MERFRSLAGDDSDFDRIREEPAFKELIGVRASSHPASVAHSYARTSGLTHGAGKRRN